MTKLVDFLCDDSGATAIEYGLMAQITMREYQIHRFWSGNNVIAPPFRISCVNDAEAIKLATKLLDDLDIEIWDGARCVTRLTSNNNGSVSTAA